MPVRTASLTRPAAPAHLDRSPRPHESAPARLGAASLAGLLLGAAAVGLAPWWSATVGLSLLAASTLNATLRTSLLSGGLSGGLAASVWAVAGATSVTASMPGVVLIVGVSGLAAWGTRTLQRAAVWPVLLPIVWMATGYVLFVALPIPRADPEFVSHLHDKVGWELAAYVLLGYLLFVAACSVVDAGKRRGRARHPFVWTTIAVTCVAFASALNLVVHPPPAVSAGEPRALDSHHVAVVAS